MLLGGLGGAAVWQWRAAVTAKATAERLNVQLSGTLDNQKQLADQLKRLADERATRARSAETARDSLIATINELVQDVDRDPNQALSAAELKQKLNAIIEKTRIEFEPFALIGD